MAEEEEEPKVLEGREAAAFVLNRTQAVLATLNYKIVEDFLTPEQTNQQNIFKYPAGEESSYLVNLITKRPSLREFFRIRTQYLSLVVPKIRLFKKIYIKQQDGTYVEDESLDESSLEFTFESFTSNAKIQQITDSKFGRSGGVGIKNVSWSYEGTNPETVRSFVNFDISLFFQSLSDFIGPSAEVADEAFRSPENTDYIQLIGAGVGTDEVDDNSPFRFEIKAELGWALSDHITEDLANDQKIEDIKRTIKETSTTLRLSMKEHTINFNQDGTFTLDISYFSAIDEIFSDEKLNILAIGSNLQGIQSVVNAQEAAREEGEREAREAQAERDADVASNPCNRRRQGQTTGSVPEGSEEEEDLVERALLAALKFEDDDSIIQNYNNIFSRILGSSKVYQVVVSADQIIEDVGLEVGKRKFLGVIPRSDAKTIARTEVLAKYLTERQLENLSGNASIEVGVVQGFELQAIDDEEAAAVRREAGQSGATSSDVVAGVIDDSLLNALETEMTAREEDGKLKIEFIRLGDILDNIIQGLKETDGSPLKERAGEFNFIFGDFIYRNFKGDRKGYNYSDMLISIEGFRAFFVEKIIRPLKVKYNLTNFIVDLANKFSYVNSIKIASEQTFVASEGRPAFSVFEGPRIQDLFFDIFPNLVTGVDEEDIDKNNFEQIYFILKSNNAPLNLSGEEEEDIARGIYHLKLGSDKGILKSINFTRDEIRGRREGRLVRAGALNSNVLREKYDASITIFGAPFIFPGSFLYLDPNMIGMGYGENQSRATSAANILGLGGYYFVNKVSNSISSDGMFETQIEASWNAFAGPDPCLKEVIYSRPDDENEGNIGIADQVSDDGDAASNSSTDAAAVAPAYGRPGRRF
jgi:hypothetical protein